MTESRYSERFVAFIDILGFSEAVRSSVDQFQDFDRIQSVLLQLSNIQPGDQGITELNWTGFSDNILISDRDDPNGCLKVGFFTEIIALKLFENGFLCRGALSWGKLVHDDRSVFGPALIDAYTKESRQAKYPRIIVTASYVKRAQEIAMESKKVKRWLEENLLRDYDGMPYINYLGRMDARIAKSSNEEKDKIKDELNTQLSDIISRYECKFDSPSIYEKYMWFADYYSDFVSRNLAECPGLKRPDRYLHPAGPAKLHEPGILPPRRSS